MRTTRRRPLKPTEYRTKAELLKPSTVPEILALYDVSYKTWRTWIKPHQEALGPLLARIYTPLQMELIFKALGYPYYIILKDEDEETKEQAA